METKKDIWAELRKPFDAKVIGKLPRGGIQLDYVGHAAVTDRLNTVDPTWTWEPMAVTEEGLPVFTPGEPQFGKPTKGLWIKLTIGGVTRPGYGDGKNEKEAIGDALRNAAMRFGVALDLWSKDELESNLEHPENKNVKAGSQGRGELSANSASPQSEVKEQSPAAPAHKITDKQIEAMFKIVKTKGAKDKVEATRILNALSGVDDFTQINTKEGSALMQKLLDTPKDAIEMLSGEAV